MAEAEGEGKDAGAKPKTKDRAILLKGRTSSKEKVRTFSITLHGLLDYDLDDSEEPTTALSLFAECFNEMMMHDYGVAILKSLLKERDLAIERGHERDRKRKRDDAEYFDRQGLGWLRLEDLRQVIHNLGADLPNRLVKDLVNIVSSSRGGRVYYKDIVEKPEKAEKAEKPAL
eukprot:gene7405-533_t